VPLTCSGDLDMACLGGHQPAGSIERGMGVSPGIPGRRQPITRRTRSLPRVGQFLFQGRSVFEGAGKLCDRLADALAGIDQTRGKFLESLDLVRKATLLGPPRIAQLRRGSRDVDLIDQNPSPICIRRIGKIAIQELQPGPSSFKISETLLEGGEPSCGFGCSPLGRIMFGTGCRLSSARPTSVGPIVCELAVDPGPDTLIGSTAHDGTNLGFQRRAHAVADNLTGRRDLECLRLPYPEQSERAVCGHVAGLARSKGRGNAQCP